jgi:hypothetical protein
LVATTRTSAELAAQRDQVVGLAQCERESLLAANRRNQLEVVHDLFSFLVQHHPLAVCREQRARPLAETVFMALRQSVPFSTWNRVR